MEALRLSQKIKFAGCLSTGVSTKKVCRSLFGDITESDREQNKMDMAAELRQMVATSSNRWNFDFENFAPRPAEKENELNWSPVAMSTEDCGVVVPGKSLVSAIRDYHPVADSACPSTPVRGVENISAFNCPQTPIRKRSPSTTQQTSSQNILRSPTPVRNSPRKQSPLRLPSTSPSYENTTSTTDRQQKLRKRSWSKIGELDSDDNDVIQIVTVSPKRPQTQQHVEDLSCDDDVEMRQCRALDFASSPVRQPTSPLANESSSPATPRTMKKRRSSMRIDDYMKQRKPRRSMVATPSNKLNSPALKSLPNTTTAFLSHTSAALRRSIAMVTPRTNESAC